MNPRSREFARTTRRAAFAKRLQSGQRAARPRALHIETPRVGTDCVCAAERIIPLSEARLPRGASPSREYFSQLRETFHPTLSVRAELARREHLSQLLRAELATFLSFARHFMKRDISSDAVGTIAG